MVKAGIFLLMRFWPVLSGTPEWFWIIAGAGACTLLIGSFFAIFQHDLKGLLAYSTISHLGLITVLLGMGTTLGVVAAVFHTLKPRDLQGIAVHGRGDHRPRNGQPGYACAAWAAP